MLPKRSFSNPVAGSGEPLSATGYPVHQIDIYLLLIRPEMPGRINFATQLSRHGQDTNTPE